jgi:membrane protein
LRLASAEEFMIDIQDEPRRRADLGGWNLAATLGLLAASFLWERLGPPENGTFPPGRERNQDARAVGLAIEGDAREPQAISRSETTKKRWKDLLLRIYGNVGEHRILALAAGMTYYSLLAIFPALAASVAIYGLFSDPSSIAKHLDLISGFVPDGAIDVVREQLTRVASKGNQTLGLTFVGGLAISLWSANAAMKSLFDTLNIVFREKEKRSFVRLNVLSLAFTLAAVVFVLVALGAVVVLPVVLNYIWLSSVVDLLIRIARWPALFVVVAVALACVYRFGPSREAPRWRWITWGSVAATVLWLVASALFSWYAANFGKFNETYGSLGAAIGFMTWLWISAIMILLGAELNAEIED